MKRNLYLSIAFLVLSACQKEDAGSGSDALAGVPAEFTATVEELPSTRIHMGEYDGKYRVLWDGYTDVVAMCAGLDASSKYRVKGATANTPVAELYAEKGTDVATEGKQIPDNVAYYPYPNTANLGDVTVVRNDDGSYTVPGAFSDAQTYLEGSVPSRGFPIVAVSDGLDDHSLNFKNVAGGICFNVKGGAHVKSISFKSNEADKVIAGDAKITVSNTDREGSVPAYEFTGTSKTIALNPASAVVTDVDAATPFYMGVAPQTFQQGFSVTLNDADGFSRTFKTTKPQEITRSHILNMPVVTFPFYGADLSSNINVEKNTTYMYDSESGSVTFTFTNTWSRCFDLPGLIKDDVSGIIDLTDHASLHMWITNSTVKLKVYLYFLNEEGVEKQLTGNTMSGSTGTVISSRKKVTFNFTQDNFKYNHPINSETGKSTISGVDFDFAYALKNVSKIRVSVDSYLSGDPGTLTLDRIVLE